MALPANTRITVTLPEPFTCPGIASAVTPAASNASVDGSVPAKSLFIATLPAIAGSSCRLLVLVPSGQAHAGAFTFTVSGVVNPSASGQYPLASFSATSADAVGVDILAPLSATAEAGQAATIGIVAA